jgi:ABC-type lipoprotein release transport system permease subunit
MDWKELLPGLYQSIQLDLYSGMIMYVILIIIVAFSILNTFLMAVIERKKELGVLMAIGTRPGRLSRILIMESSMITLIGICAGTVSGSLLTLYFQNVGIVLPGTGELLREFGIPDRIYPKLSAASITVGPAIVLVITVLTSLYPACKVWRISMVKAIAATPQ